MPVFAIAQVGADGANRVAILATSFDAEARAQDQEGPLGLLLGNAAAALALLVVGWANHALHASYPALIGWLPAGLALGLIMVKGPRLAPGVFFGMLALNALVHVDAQRATTVAAATTLVSLLIWWTLEHRAVRALARSRISDVALRLLLAALMATAAAIATGPIERAAMSTMHGGSHALEWVLADAIGILLVVPLALRAYQWPHAAEPWSWRKGAPGLAILGLLVGVAVAVYGGFLESQFGIRHTTLLTLPPAIWLALKFDLRYTLAGNLAVFVVTGVGTSLGHGPFSDHTAGLPLLSVITLFTTLLVAAGRTERKAAEAKIFRMATEDMLTGLPNRAAFDQRLALALGNARRYGRQVAVMFIDLDRFKRVNDTLGHEVGDRLLVEASHRLASSLRGDSLLARFGGDEFIAVIDHVEGPGAPTVVGQRMLAALADPIVIDGHPCSISLSGGIALYPDDGTNAVELLKNADVAMYHIKTRGRNGFQHFADLRATPAAAAPAG